MQPALFFESDPFPGLPGPPPVGPRGPKIDRQIRDRICFIFPKVCPDTCAALGHIASEAPASGGQSANGLCSIEQPRDGGSHRTAGASEMGGGGRGSPDLRLVIPPYPGPCPGPVFDRFGP